MDQQAIPWWQALGLFVGGLISGAGGFKLWKTNRPPELDLLQNRVSAVETDLRVLRNELLPQLTERMSMLEARHDGSDETRDRQHQENLRSMAAIRREISRIHPADHAT